MPKKLWFKQKSFGWGWTPCSWEGWVVLGAYLVLLFCIVGQDKSDSSKLTNEVFINQIFPIGVLTLILLYICYKTGEKPEWRWGKKK